MLADNLKKCRTINSERNAYGNTNFHVHSPCRVQGTVMFKINKSQNHT